MFKTLYFIVVYQILISYNYVFGIGIIKIIFMECETSFSWKKAEDDVFFQESFHASSNWRFSLKSE